MKVFHIIPNPNTNPNNNNDIKKYGYYSQY